MIEGVRRRFFRISLALAVLAVTSCSPYAGVDVGVPFKVGPVYVNPSIGVGGFL